MRALHLLLIGCLTAVATPSFAAEPETATNVPKENLEGIPPELAAESRAAIHRGVQWLLAQQQEDGHWSNSDFPALTALPLWALVKCGGADSNQIDRAVRCILSSVRADGSIWREPQQQQRGGGLSNYNTAICMVALNLVGRADLAAVIQKAREYVASSQYGGDSPFKGGMGYNKESPDGREHADLSNSYTAYEAMRLTQNVEDLRSQAGKKVDLDWAAAIEFVMKMQDKMPEPPHGRGGPGGPGRTARPGMDDGHRGHGPGGGPAGFGYTPSESHAGTTNGPQGEVRLRAYGSMTYAGLLSLIYAQVNQNDPRVKSAFDWAVENWSLEENPGMQMQGLYYFYNILAKGMAAYGQDILTLKDGTRINWRREVLRKLVSLQKTDQTAGQGYWVNENNRWWERDPVLVTAYSLIAMQIALDSSGTAQ